MVVGSTWEEDSVNAKGGSQPRTKFREGDEAQRTFQYRVHTTYTRSPRYRVRNRTEVLELRLSG